MTNFAVEVMREYDSKPFHSISRGDLDLDDVESQEVKKETENIAKTNEDLIKDIKETLGDKVADVKISSRLKSSAVCLVADEMGPSFAMEQVFADTNNPMFKANAFWKSIRNTIYSPVCKKFTKQQKTMLSLKITAIFYMHRHCSSKALCRMTRQLLPTR